MATENITHSTDGTLLQWYNFVFQTYTQSGQNVTSMCAGIEFINKGTTTVTINQTLILQPEQSFSLQANTHELDTTQYTLNFGATGNPLCVVIRKYYTS